MYRDRPSQDMTSEPFRQRQSYCEHCAHNQYNKHCDSNIICMSVNVCMNIMSNDVILYFLFGYVWM